MVASKLDRAMNAILTKPAPEVTPEDMKIIEKYLEGVDFGIPQDTLDFLNTPEQVVITRGRIAAFESN